jgi:hypothetical protein
LLFESTRYSHKLNTRPEYSIRFANDDVWENTSGYNQLNQTVDTRKVTSDKVWVWQPEDISVYPNPAYGHLYIKSYTVSGPATVSTSNILGEIVDKKNVEGHGESGSEILLDISDFNNGIYF